MPVNMGTAVAYLELDTSKFMTGFTRAKQELKVFGDSSATAGKKAEGLGKSMQVAGMTMTKGLTVPLAAVGTVAINVSMDFEQSMSNVRAISGATGEEFDALRDRAIELGASTVFSATEVADAMTEMAKAGWDSQQIMDGMEGVLNAASASGEGLATVSTIVADAITTFGLAASDSTRVADLLAQSANAGTINITDLGETFKYIGPIAKTMGFSIEDVTTAITALSTAGIKGSQAGTSLRTMFARMVKPTEQVQAAMDELGITLTDSEGNFRSMDDILASMRSTFQTLTPEQQTYYATVLAGQEGMSGLTALLGMTQEEYDKIAESMDNATGVAKETAEVMQDNLKGSLEQLQGSLESAGIVIGETLSPMIRDLADFISRAVDSFNDLDEETQQTIVQFALLVAAIGPVTTVGGKMLRSFVSVGRGFRTVASQASYFVQALQYSGKGMADVAKQISPLYSGLSRVGSVMGAMASPAGIAVAAIGAVAGAMIIGNQAAEARIVKFAELSEEQQKLVDSINALKESSDSLAENREQTVAGITSEYDATRNLAEELRTLVDENGRVKEGAEQRAQVITGKLSEALGQEISITDGVIDNYGELSASIDDVITKTQALAVQQAFQDDYQTAIEQRTQAEKDYAQSLEEITKAQEDLKEAEAELTSLRENPSFGPGWQDSYERAIEKVEGLQEKLGKLEDASQDAEDSMTEFNQTIENYEGLSAAIVEGDVTKINDALLKLQEGFLTANNATRESLEQQAETMQTEYEKAQKALESGAEGMTQETVDRLKQMSEMANQELANKIQADIDTVTQLFSDLGITAPQELIEAVTAKDPEVVQSVTTMLNNLSSGVQLKSSEIETLFSNLGVDAPGDLISQLGSMEPSVQASALNLLMQLQNAETEQRPAILQQLRDLGIKIDDNLAGGIESNSGRVEDSSGNVGKKGHDKMQSELQRGNLNPPDVNALDTGQGAVWRNSTQSYFDRNPLSIAVNVAARGVGAVRGAIGSLLSGSHANGLDYVPYNGYIAELHKGERVLTAEENKAYNAGRSVAGSTGGDTFVFYNTQPEPYEYARQMKRAKRELNSGF